MSDGVGDRGRSSATGILERALGDRVTAVEARVVSIEQEVREHEARCADERTAIAERSAADAKSAGRWMVGLALGIVATAFFAGGTWIATVRQVDENERALISVGAVQEVNTPAIATLVRNQRKLGSGQRHLSRQLAEIVVANQEGRKARLIPKEADDLEPVGAAHGPGNGGR